MLPLVLQRSPALQRPSCLLFHMAANLLPHTLQFTEMVLRLLDTGAEAVEEVCCVGVAKQSVGLVCTPFPFQLQYMPLKHHCGLRALCRWTESMPSRLCRCVWAVLCGCKGCIVLLLPDELSFLPPQYGAAPPELQRAAAVLVDTYWPAGAEA